MTSLNDGLILNLQFDEGTGTKTLTKSKKQNQGYIYGPVFVEPFESATKGAWIKADWNKETCKRMKITIDSSKVDADLTNFPVYINLSTTSGIGDVDVSAVFDELGANSLKLAIATFSGIQCYVEVVSWDNVGEIVELWAKIPYISSSVDTIIYLYYDVTHADNTDFVGITGSAAGEQVWDANFKIVCHMNDNPDTSHVMDSTMQTYARKLFIGKGPYNPTPDGFFDGMIADLKIYSRALSPEEIRLLYLRKIT